MQAYSRWKQDNASATAYELLRTVSAFIKGGSQFSPGDFWTRHLLVRCLILIARKPDLATKPVELREDALKYCIELRGQFGNAKEAEVSLEDIVKMQELIELEQSVFDSQPHPSALQKVKAKAFHLFVKRMRLE